MNRIANLLQARIIGRKIIAQNLKISVYASRNYNYQGFIENWYGLMREDYESIQNQENEYFIFTTNDINNFLVIPLSDFKSKLLPYLRPSWNGHYFLFQRNGENCFLPLYYIPVKSRKGLVENGILMNKYVNNLSYLGIKDEHYFKSQDVAETTKPIQTTDEMVKALSEREPSFFSKSIEEKLIILRYHQIFGE